MATVRKRCLPPARFRILRCPENAGVQTVSLVLAAECTYSERARFARFDAGAHPKQPQPPSFGQRQSGSAHRSAGTVPGGPRIWSPSSAETEAKRSRSVSVSGAVRCAGVAARAISSANPAGELINKLRQPFGPALIACGVLSGMAQ